jgi:hypothetical protein
MPGAGRFATDVDNLSARLNHTVKMRAGRIEINEIATVGERVGREVENTDEVRAFPKRKIATSGVVDAHINLSNNDT